MIDLHHTTGAKFRGQWGTIKMSDLKGINASLVAQMVKNLPAMWYMKTAFVEKNLSHTIISDLHWFKIGKGV